MRNFVLWFVAIAITLGAVVYQRLTGPTNPERISFIFEGDTYTTRLTRSLSSDVTLEEAKGDYHSLGKRSVIKFTIKGLPEVVNAEIYYKQYKSYDTLKMVVCEREGDKFVSSLPSEPPAGKLEYFVRIYDAKNAAIGGPVTIRFKNHVPNAVLIPHILFMFISMLLANFAGVISFFNIKRAKFYALLTIISLFIGGLILGPIVQKYAFGAYWTGWPFGGDLTDNKTLFALIIWVIAYFANNRKQSALWFIAASIIMLLVYCIPHSTSGSEFDYNNKSVVTSDK